MMLLSHYRQDSLAYPLVIPSTIKENSTEKEREGIVDPSSESELVQQNKNETNDSKREQGIVNIKQEKEASCAVKPKLGQTRSKSNTTDTTPSFYNILKYHCEDCLPNAICQQCLSDLRGDCNLCGAVCKCFCKQLCRVPVKLPVNKIFEYHRLTPRAPGPTTNEGNKVNDLQQKTHENQPIPKIIHQTWVEPITKEKHPKISLLQSSWKRKGWEYRFYDDNDIINFISQHFPIEVLDAYNTLIPGAYKADLFRYCLLLIYGGVYADFDVLCEADLDIAIDDNVGFLVPVDVDRCLWNGFMASVPGHPFLAAAIEGAVNNIRNRLTTVDIMNNLCHDSKLDSFLMNHEDLYLTGPCLLGIEVNNVLGRPFESSFSQEEDYDKLVENSPVDIPGRVVILESHTNHWMGGIRFILPSKNLLVAATNFPVSDDTGQSRSATSAHYSSLIPRKSGRVFGSFDVYKDYGSMNENIKLIPHREV